MSTSPYANETYLRSLAASQGDVNRQVGNALQEVVRQRDIGLARSAQVPGAAARLYDDGRGTLQGDLASLNSAGGRPIGPLASVTGAFQDSKASYKQVGGLLGQGFRERSDRQTGEVKNLQQTLLAELRDKGNEYVSRREGEDRQMAFQAQQGAAARTLQEEMMRRQQAMQEAAAAEAVKEAQKQRDFEIYLAQLEAGMLPSGAGLDPTLLAKARDLVARQNIQSIKDRQH